MGRPRMMLNERMVMLSLVRLATIRDCSRIIKTCFGFFFWQQGQFHTHVSYPLLKCANFDWCVLHLLWSITDRTSTLKTFYFGLVSLDQLTTIHHHLALGKRKKKVLSIPMLYQYLINTISIPYYIMKISTGQDWLNNINQWVMA